MADVVVIGAGIAGASVAFGAARRGATVTVIDDHRPGRATDAGAGIVAPWATALTGEVYDLYAAGADEYPAVLDALASVGIDDAGYHRNGVLVLGDRTPEASDRLAQRVAASEVAGRIEIVDPDAVRHLFPPLRPDEHGVHVPGGARVDGRLLTAALLDGVRRHGGSVRAGRATVADATCTVDGSVVDGDSIVIAAGAWSPPLAAPHHVGVEGQRGQICHLRLDDADTGGWPSVLPPADHYIVPFGDGRVVVGATREVAVDEVRVTADGVRHVLSNALALAPGLADASLVETRVGIRPFPTSGHRPTVGPVDDRTWVVTGFGAIGLTIGPFVGDRVASALLGHGTDPLLVPFAPS